jgi:hypothetical protein|nr:hypothetical protein [Prevotella sp. UBA4952]
MMKRIDVFVLLLVLMAFFPAVMKADDVIDRGGPIRMWTVPTVYEVDKPVTFYFDMTDAGFRDGVDLYLWCWNPTEPDAANWANSSDFAKLTYEGDNVYSMTITPTKYFSGGATGKTPDDIYAICQTDDWAGFWARLKTRDGSEESAVFQIPDSRQTWKNFAASGSAVQFYSAQFQGNALNLTDKFTLDKALTIVFNPDLFMIGEKSMTEFAKQAGFGGFKLHSGLNDWTYLQGVKAWIPACMDKVDIARQTNGYYTISMKTVYDYYSSQYADDGSVVSNNLESDEQIDNMAWLVVGILNGEWGVTSANQLNKAGTAEVYPDPVFSVFPTKVSAYDILTLIRQYNGKRDGVLTWTLTAGNKSFSGTLDGTRDKRQSSVNLLKELAGTQASTMHLSIKNDAGTEVVSTDIPLVTPDDE